MIGLLTLLIATVGLAFAFVKVGKMSFRHFVFKC
jgi:hypothetical protein